MPESGSGESTDLIDIASGVGTALVDWAVDGTPVGVIIDVIQNIIGNDSEGSDSLLEYAQEQNVQLDSILTELKELNSNTKALQADVQGINDSVQALAAVQSFFFVSTFTILFCGFLGQRVKRLFRWRRMSKNEGLM